MAFWRTKHPAEWHPITPPRQAAQLSDDDRPIIIRLKDVRKIYDIGTPRETLALKGINLEISLAEIVILFGSSGSGKSTLLNILAGLDSATTGTVEIDGKDLAKTTAHELALYHQFKVGMVFQSYNLVQTLTVMQNITMPARLAGFKRKDYQARGQDLLKQFDLEKLSDHLPGECSGGQQQRVGIMRAFMNRPSFIIADEPTGNLDSQNAKKTMDLFKGLNTETNTTMLIVTHDPSLFAIADRVVHITDGKIVKQTILTTKAKVDPKTIDVPVEYMQQPKDREEFIGMYTGVRGEQVKKDKKRLEELERQARNFTQEKAQLAQQQHQLEEQLKQVESALQDQSLKLRQREVERQGLEAEREAIRREKARLAEEGLRLQDEKQDVTFAQQFLEHEERRLEKEKARVEEALQALASRQDLGTRQHALEEEKKRLEAGWQQVKTAQAALATEKARFDQEMRQRIEIANNIVDHEKEQLETERREQEERQKQRAMEMERRLTAAGELIKQQTAQLNAEYELIKQAREEQAEEARQLAAEKEQLAAEKARLAGRQKTRHPRSTQPTALQLLLRQLADFSLTQQYILEALSTILSHTQQLSLKRPTIIRIMEAIEFRLYDIFNQQELREMLDRPSAKGGVGLRRETAERIATAIEVMIRLGKLKPSDRSK